MIISMTYKHKTRKKTHCSSSCLPAYRTYQMLVASWEIKADTHKILDVLVDIIGVRDHLENWVKLKI